MKLRPLAKGHEYCIVDLHLRIVRKCCPSYEQDVWDCDEAPASCFADAEEPLRKGERVVVEVPDGHMGESGEVVGIIETDGGASIEVLLDGETCCRQYRHSGLRREPTPEGEKP